MWATTGAFVLLAASPAALAQSREDVDRAKASFQAGATAYAAGEYLAAIQALESAYALTPLPAIAFSLAQAERRQYFVARDPQQLLRAIELYRRYLEQVPTGGRRADALDALSQLEPLALNLPGRSSDPLQKASVAPRQTRVMITADVPGVALSLDGGPPAPSPLIREVEPGVHSAHATADGFVAASREVTAVAGELVPASLTLQEKPSTLTVWAPYRSEVYVDGALASRNGGRLDLKLPSGPHHVTVAEKGRRVENRALTLGRGTATDLTVTMSPTRQRRVSRALFIAGGATVVVGAVLGVLAANAQGRAQDFLDRRTDGNVTGTDLADYNDAVTARDRYRAAAVIGLGAGAGLLAAGLILYELDNPDPRDLVAPGPLRPPAAPAPGSGMALSPTLRHFGWRVAPVATGDTWGAAAALHF